MPTIREGGGKTKLEPPQMDTLPESCIAHVISLTSPRDACTAAATSAAFRSAADSDTVWTRFLPSDHHEIVSSAVDPVSFSTKKELYRRLCDSILIDGGNISFGLEKGSGKKRIVTSARGLSIVWGDTPRYWKWKEAENSRFAEVAELTSVCWLEIKATINTYILSPRTTYCVYLIFNTAHGSYGLTFPTQETSIKIGSRVISKHNVCLQPDESDPPKPCLTLLGRSAVFRVPPRPTESDGPVQSPVTREDGWMELEMGRFFIEEGKGSEVDISLMEIKGGHWKRGLVVQGIELRPVE